MAVKCKVGVQVEYVFRMDSLIVYVTTPSPVIQNIPPENLPPGQVHTKDEGALEVMFL